MTVSNKTEETCWLAVSKLTKKKLPFVLNSSNGKSLSIPPSQISKSCPSNLDLNNSKKRIFVQEEINNSKKYKTINFDNSQNFDVLNFWKNMEMPKLNEMEPPQEFLSDLRSYQKQALCWMHQRENPVYKDLPSYVTEKTDWEEKRTEEGKTYYFHHIFGTSWEKPSPPNNNLIEETKQSYLNTLQGGILADDMGNIKKFYFTFLIFFFFLKKEWEKQSKSFL